MSAFPELTDEVKAMLDTAESRAAGWKDVADATRKELLKTRSSLALAEARVKELETVLLKRLEDLEKDTKKALEEGYDQRKALYNAWEEGYQDCADIEDIEGWRELKPFNPYSDGYAKAPSAKAPSAKAPSAKAPSAKARTLSPIPVFDGKDEERLELYRQYSNGEITYNAYTMGLHDLEFKDGASESGAPGYMPPRPLKLNDGEDALRESLYARLVKREISQLDYAKALAKLSGIDMETDMEYES